MKYYFNFRPLLSLLLILFLTLNISAQNNKKKKIETANFTSLNQNQNNLDYIESASVVISKVWLKQTRRGNHWVEHILLEPREIQLVPTSNDFAELLFELDCDDAEENCVSPIPMGTYNQVKVILESGVVVLTEDAKVDEGNSFSTILGNLQLPSGSKTGVIIDVAPPIRVETTLTTELNLDLDLTKSFVFNGSPSKGNGVKQIVFRPLKIPAINSSTNGLISLRVLKTNSDIGKCEDEASPVEGAVISVINQSGITQGTTISDINGEAWLTMLPGIYNIGITSPGNEPISIENQTVYIANHTELGDVIFGRNSIADLAFNEERAILLAVMANTAYAKPGHSGWKNSIENSKETDTLPYPFRTKNNEKTYAGNLETNWSEYDCWNFYQFIGNLDPENNLDPGTQGFIAYNVNNGDIVVSFRGTTTGENSKYEDILDDALAVPAPWFFSDYPDIDRPDPILFGVHLGIRNAYNYVKQELQDALDMVIKKRDINTSNSRIYFTGHSLGGALAELAALDLIDYLNYEKGFSRKNIMMYSYGAPRVITYNLLPHYDKIVPNSHAVAAKDDYVTHFFDIVGLFPTVTDFAHIDNMAVLSTSIINPNEYDEKGYYTSIGKTRIEFGNDQRSCIGPSDTSFLCVYGFTRNYHGCGSVFTKLGHDQLQYLKRLETIDDGPKKGIPSINIKLVKIGAFNNIERLKLFWDKEVQGPCDWVGLFKTESGVTLTSTDDLVGLLGVNNSKYVNKPSDADDKSDLRTGVNPNLLLNEDYDFWVGYVDGFGNIINKKKYERLTSASIVDKGISNFTLYPNSVNDIIKIEGLDNGLNPSYNIYDSLGIKKGSGVLKNNEINVETLFPGIYILKFDSDKESVFTRFIKN